MTSTIDLDCPPNAGWLVMRTKPACVMAQLPQPPWACRANQRCTLAWCSCFGQLSAMSALTSSRCAGGAGTARQGDSSSNAFTCAAVTRGASGGSWKTQVSPFFFIALGGALARRINSDTACPNRRERALA